MARGSDAVIKELFGTKKRLSKEELRSAIDRARREGLDLRCWLINGQPRPEYIEGQLMLKPELFAEVSEALLNLHNEQRVVNYDVFPIGIPKPELVQLNIKTRLNVLK